MLVKIEYKDDIVYFHIGEGETKPYQVATDEGIIVDFDSEGNLSGIEIPLDILPKKVQENVTNSFSES